MKAKGRYRIFSSHPTDKILMFVDGETVVSYGTLWLIRRLARQPTKNGGKRMKLLSIADNVTT